MHTHTAFDGDHVQEPSCVQLEQSEGIKVIWQPAQRMKSLEQIHQLQRNSPRSFFQSFITIKVQPNTLLCIDPELNFDRNQSQTPSTCTSLELLSPSRHCFLRFLLLLYRKTTSLLQSPLPTNTLLRSKATPIQYPTYLGYPTFMLDV